MRRQQLESLTLQIVDRVLRGCSNEDSFIELKSEWPDVGKARQLAGHANSANGEEIVWIIGVDEKNRCLTTPARQDPAKWWSQVSSRFDDNVAPEMMDLVVPVRPGMSVTALAFKTDRAPYVVSVSNGGTTERDVPIRSGTRTRSATRHELLRFLVPAATVPECTAASCRIQFVTLRGKDDCFLFGSCEVLFELSPNQSAFIPGFGMGAILEIFDQDGTAADRAPLKVKQPDPYSRETDTTGVAWSGDGLRLQGPAAVSFTLREAGRDATTWIDEWIGERESLGSAELTLTLKVAGALRRTQLHFPLELHWSANMSRRGWDLTATYRKS